MEFLSRIYEFENAIEIFNPQNTGNEKSSDQACNIINNFQKYWRDYILQYNSRITSLNSLTPLERKNIGSFINETRSAHADLENELRKNSRDYNSIVGKKNQLKNLIVTQTNNFNKKYEAILSSDLDLSKQSPK